MALVLCQQCLSWVEPIAEQCPQCDYPIDLRTGDPTLDEIAAAIGSLIAPIGPVRLSRTALPDRGQLYATGGGLFFVPQFAEQIRLVSTEDAPRSRSTTRALLRAPLQLLRSGVAIGAYRSPMRVDVLQQELPLLGPSEGHRLPQILMDHPGAFFFARRAIRTIRQTFAGWAIGRPNNLMLRIKPLGDRAAFNRQMSIFAHEIVEAVCR